MGQHALVHQLHLAHVVVRVGHEAEAVKKEQQETWVKMMIIERAEGRQSLHLDCSYKVACLSNTVRTDKVSQALDSLDEHVRPAAWGWTTKAVLGAQHLC